MNVAQVIDHLREDNAFCAHLTAWRSFAAQPGRYAPFPEFPQFATGPWIARFIASAAFEYGKYKITCLTVTR